MKKNGLFSSDVNNRELERGEEGVFQDGKSTLRGNSDPQVPVALRKGGRDKEGGKFHRKY